MITREGFFRPWAGDDGGEFRYSAIYEAEESAVRIYIPVKGRG
jgi:hypothetical protein